MADEQRRSEDGGVEQGPGLAYQSFVQMENLLDKFKLLHYEESFCQQLGFKPFSRYGVNSVSGSLVCCLHDAPFHTTIKLRLG